MTPAGGLRRFPAGDAGCSFVVTLFTADRTGGSKGISKLGMAARDVFAASNERRAHDDLTLRARAMSASVAQSRSDQPAAIA